MLYVEVLKKRTNNVGRTFCDAVNSNIQPHIRVNPLKLFPDDLHQNPLPPPTIKFSIKDLFPGAEIKPPIGDCNNNLPPHHGPFQMGSAINT